jgi:methionyl-tRNA formyltransferase
VDARGDVAINNCIVAAAGLRNPEAVTSSDTLSSPETIDLLRARRLDLIILAWWPYLLREPLLSLPRLGCLNFHPSYLPYNRGKHPNFWSLVEETPFGVTLHFADTGVDTGDIAFQSRIDTTWEDTGETLYRKAQCEIVRLFRDVFPRIQKGEIPRLPQDLSEGSFHRARELEPASRIDMDRSYRGRELLNLLRARTFSGYPGAWFVENGQRFEVRVQIVRVPDEKQKANSEGQAEDS